MKIREETLTVFMFHEVQYKKYGIPKELIKRPMKDSCFLEWTYMNIHVIVVRQCVPSRNFILGWGWSDKDSYLEPLEWKSMNALTLSSAPLSQQSFTFSAQAANCIFRDLIITYDVKLNNFVRLNLILVTLVHNLVFALSISNSY